jgi:hypothetical protein
MRPLGSLETSETTYTVTQRHIPEENTYSVTQHPIPEELTFKLCPISSKYRLNNKLKRIWKEADLGLNEVLFTLPVLRKTTGKLYSRNRDLKFVPLKYKARDIWVK